VVIKCKLNNVFEDYEKLVAGYCTLWINQVSVRLVAVRDGYVRIMTDHLHC